MPFFFFSEYRSFQLSNPAHFANWLEKALVSLSKKKKAGDINYIFCSDHYLRSLNQKHLNHDYFTDIITFDLSAGKDQINADIYISIDRVKENASVYNVPFKQEISRVMVHGLLHLIGFGDNSPIEKKRMREKEDACLSLQKQECST